jgi:hypothetical protein
LDVKVGRIGRTVYPESGRMVIVGFKERTRTWEMGVLWKERGGTI